MYITDIYKIVVRDANSLNSVVDPRIFFERVKAEEFAKAILAEGKYDDKPIGDIIIYREVPDISLGWFRTAGQSRIEK